MTVEPWLTVVTVVRNDAAALRATIDSMTGQSMLRPRATVPGPGADSGPGGGVEHLIIDGASSDGTTDIARAHVDRHNWARLISEPDTGIYDAMNKGTRHARGARIHFLNAGDIYADPAAVAWVRNRVRLRNSAWLRTPVQFVDATDRPSRKLGSARLDPGWFVAGRQPVFHQGAFMTRSLLVDLGGFDTRYFLAADYDLMRRALAAGIRPDVAERVLVRVDDAGVSTQHWLESLRQVRESRSSGGTVPDRIRSAAIFGGMAAEVALKRGARRAAESMLGTQGLRRLRGVT